MKKIYAIPILMLLVGMLVAETASALFPSPRDCLRAQLLFRSPDASPIYFRGGLISNLYGDLPAKYSPFTGQISFPHYFLGSYGYGGTFAYRPNDYLIYGKPFWNLGGYAGYWPEQTYGQYPYDQSEYARGYGWQNQPYNYGFY